MSDPDTISARTRAAVEKAARVMAGADGCSDASRCLSDPHCMCQDVARAIIAAYLRAQGRDIEANQVEGIRDDR